jgi:hypothetical protein
MSVDNAPLDPQAADHTTTDTLANLPIQTQEKTKYAKNQEPNA